MSQPVPCGLVVPRWSVVPVQPGGLAGMASTAGLPEGSAIVWVGPPLLASGPSCGLVVLLEVLAVEEPHVDPVPMLRPVSGTGCPPPQLGPPWPLATTLMPILSEKPV